MIAVALSIGLHWVVLQSVAWVGMVVDYSAEYSLTTAIEKTFDGDHKCRICRLVEDGTQADEDSGFTFKPSKLDGINDGSKTVLSPSAEMEVFLLGGDAVRSWISRPPTPPPPVA
mgnify:FL=1